MNIDKQKLKALAEAAVPGPWECREAEGTSAVCWEKGWVADSCTDQDIADNRYIAAASPATVLALLAEIERHEKNGDALMYKAGMENVAKQRDQFKAENGALRDGANFRAIQSLRADCEALRKDAERYRGVRRVANRQGFTDEQFDQQTDSRVASFDAAMAKETSR